MTDSEPSLVDLASRAFSAHLAGDWAALEPLVEAVTPLLWHTARAQGADAAAAQDAVQTAWLRLVEHSTRIEDPRSVLKWLITTTRREAWATTRRSRRTTPVDAWDEPLPGDGPGRAPEQPEAAAERAETGSLVWAHVARLSPRCQKLLRIIAFVERPDYVAVGAALDMPVGSIGPTRGRCLGKLRASLELDPAWAVTR